MPRWLKRAVLLSALALTGWAAVWGAQPALPDSENGLFAGATHRTLYQGYRFVYRGVSLALLTDYEQLVDSRLAVYYRPDQRDDANLVRAAAAEVYEGTARVVGVASPPRMPVVMHPDRQSLDAAFGWRGGESASGAYWAGVVHVLSPSAWLPWVSVAQRDQVYRRLSPLAHETTHYLLDYRTGGNYPRWFTEGLAQWVEYRLIGYYWRNPSGQLDGSTYSYEDLASRFDRLSNQALAYRQALALVDYVARRCGTDSLEQIISGLATGRSFTASVRSTCGDTPAEMMARWLAAGRPPYPEEPAVLRVHPRAGVQRAIAERWR